MGSPGADNLGSRRRKPHENRFGPDKGISVRIRLHFAFPYSKFQLHQCRAAGIGDVPRLEWATDTLGKERGRCCGHFDEPSNS